MKNSRGVFGKRVFVAIICAILVLSMPLFIDTPKVSAAPDEWTETTDTDFQDGIFSDVVLKGSGVPAYLELDEISGWHNMTSGLAPLPRENFGFAFDSKYNRAILFGGVVTPSLTYYNDTWAYSYNSNTWTKLINDGTPGSPAPRSGCGMAYDSTDEVVVLYGGFSVATGFLFDTWEFDVDTNTWTKFKPPTSPSIENIAMVYDSVADRMILAGSHGIDPGTFETWAYDAGTDTWLNRAPSTQPESRFGHAMAFSGSVSVLQGGRLTVLDPGAPWPDDYWKYTYSTNSWLECEYGGAPTPTRPSQKIDHAMARYFNDVADVYGEPNFPLLLWEHLNLISPYACDGWVDVSLSSGLPVIVRAGHEMVWDSYNEVIILFGGRKSPSGSATPADYLNETWVYGLGYATSGYYVSKVGANFYYNSNSAYTNWGNIYWNKTPAQQPGGTKLKFQLQGDNNSVPGDASPGETSWIGPGGSTMTYYETPGDAIDGLTHRRYIRYKAIFEGTIQASPELQDVTIGYATEGPPYITSTDPAHNEGSVPLWKNITVEFNEPMDEGTVMWTFSDPSITWLPDEWSPDSKTLYLKHTNPFEESTLYEVEVTAGKDLDGFDLVSNPAAPNPWQFTTGFVKPWIVWTDPYDGETDVELSRNIIVQFSEPMIPASVDFTVLPWIPLKADYTVEWGNSDSTLFLNHSSPFQECTIYNAFITSGTDLKGNPLDPGVGVANPWEFTTYCSQPYVSGRDPEHASTGVPLDKNIIITFSKEMAIGTVNWYVAMDNYDNPPVDLGWSEVWESVNTVLNISHSTPFTQNQKYCVNVTSGEDGFGNPLNRTVDLARWCFTTTTVSVSPWIAWTDPFDGETGVDINKDIIVKFSESMIPGSLTWTISPLIALTPTWSETDTKVTFTHATPFDMCQLYTVEITNAQDTDGNPLDPGVGAPNPWSFTTSIGAAHNLRVERSPPNIIIKWDPVAGASEYRIYESQDRFAAWPWTLLGTSGTNQYTHAGAHDDSQDHFYIVRAYEPLCEESTNSTMGAKAHLSFTMPVNPNLTDINWLSLPFNTIYTKASDIAGELTSAKIRAVGKWDPSKQRAIMYTFAKGKWRGSDFTISAGEGIFVAGLQTDFYWVINGTDSVRTLNFLYYPKHTKNIYWVSLPYTGIYYSASWIVLDIEGSLIVAPNYVIEVGKWDPATQTSTRFYWDSGSWIGTDFTINPGDGIYLIIKNSFPWFIKLLIPTVP